MRDFRIQCELYAQPITRILTLTIDDVLHNEGASLRPAPVVARALGFHHATTHRQHNHAGGTGIATSHPGTSPAVPRFLTTHRTNQHIHATRIPEPPSRAKEVVSDYVH